MTKFKFILWTMAIFIFARIDSYAQGCSDAGICTLNSFKPNSTEGTKLLKNELKLAAFFGKADHSISVYGSYLEYNRQLKNNFGFGAKLTTLAQNGNGISVNGLSDIFISAHYRASERIKLTIATKIPLSKANKTYNNLALPMDYQSSLGILDVIFGIGYEIKKIQFVAAIQQPLTNNDNQFIATNYPINSELRTFQSTNKFVRSGDALLRISYPINVNSKFKITPSILPIYHLANDKYTDEFNVKKEIKGSQGLTLNGNVYLDYEINNKNKMQFNLGLPFIVRKSRPDGLTRSIIANLEYQRQF